MVFVESAEHEASTTDQHSCLVPFHSSFVPHWFLLIIYFSYIHTSSCHSTTMAVLYKVYKDAFRHPEKFGPVAREQNGCWNWNHDPSRPMGTRRSIVNLFEDPSPLAVAQQYQSWMLALSGLLCDSSFHSLALNKPKAHISLEISNPAACFSQLV